MEYTGERMIPAHDGKAGEGGIEVHDLMYREFLIATENKEVLDIACGCGHGTKLIAGRARKVWAFDISQDAIEFARKYQADPKVTYEVGDICNIPMGHESVDVVVSVETFEHVSEIDRLISEVHRVLRPHGTWCFTTPNGERYPYTDKEQPRRFPYHVRHYTRRDLDRLIGGRFIFHVRETGYEPDVSQAWGIPTFGNYSVFAVKR